MRYFEIGSCDDVEYESLNFIPPLEATDRMRAAGGRLLTEGWPPIDAELTLVRYGKRLPRAELRKNVDGLLIREGACALLKHLLAGCGVPLPIRMAGDDPYFLFQVVQIDCLDEKQTVYTMIREDIRLPRKAVLRGDCIVGFNIFSPTGFPQFIFASETFRDAVTAAGFKGISFRDVPVT
jgi:hypothetical protein